jgi:septal ring factor EnvC (AmiA/AmiB activator)
MMEPIEITQIEREIEQVKRDIEDVHLMEARLQRDLQNLKARLEATKLKIKKSGVKY